MTREYPAAFSEVVDLPDPRVLSRTTLTLGEWLKRDLPGPDRLMGEWLTTTSRVLLSAKTGLGKTNLGLALSIHIAAGVDFLHWQAHRPARVLFVDGEMSRQLLKRRAQDAARRLGKTPDGLHLLSREDVDDFPALNTPAGKAYIEQLATKLEIDLATFDNVMSLTIGNQKDEDAWAATLPLVTSLTKRRIGQIWIDHTGHDTQRAYGSNTKQWRMDTVAHLTEAKRADTDVSFSLEFQKARERTPETRADFENVSIALVNDEWIGSAATGKRGKPSPLDEKFLEALRDALAGDNTTRFQNWKAIKFDFWNAECVTRGLIDRKAKPDSARALFSKHRRSLIACNLIACNNELVWLL